MPENSADGRGVAAHGDIGRAAAVTGDSNNVMNLNIDLNDMPTSEPERRAWTTRQILELRNALIGDSRYGVDGLVESVQKLRAWLIVLGVLLFFLLLAMIWQQFQIHQIFQQLQRL